MFNKLAWALALGVVSSVAVPSRYDDPKAPIGFSARSADAAAATYTGYMFAYVSSISQ